MASVLGQYAPTRTVRNKTRLLIFKWVFLLERKRNCQTFTVPRHTRRYQMEEISRELIHIYRNCYYLRIEPSEWKGSVTHGLGAGISLPPCLATGIWNLAPKATSGPKSRGPSFGTTLWRHVQRYCAQFLVIMQISPLGIFWRNSNFPWTDSLKESFLSLFFFLCWHLLSSERHPKDSQCISKSSVTVFL